MCSKTYTVLDVYRWIFGIVLGDADVAALLRSYQKHLLDVVVPRTASSPTLLWLPPELCLQSTPLFTRNLGVLGVCAVRDILLASYFIKKGSRNLGEDISQKLHMLGRGEFEVRTPESVFGERLQLRATVGARVICCNLLGKGIWFDTSF